MPFVPMQYRTAANILYIDLEISKSLVFNYGLRVPSTYINPDDLYRPRYVICWAASYLGSDKVWSECVTQKEAKRWDDKRILGKLRDLMESADIIAGHNVQSFDIKHANARFLINGMEPVVHKKVLDTLKIARSKFAFESNKLDYISKILGFRPKDDVTNKDWLKIVTSGDEATLKKIKKYCRGDVRSGKDILDTLMKYSGKKSFYGSVSLELPINWLKRM